MDVRAFADASSDAATGSPPTVKVIELTGTRNPLYDDLRGFFLAKADASDPDAAAIEARIQQFTRTAIDRARRARQHARAVVQLTMHMPESALEMVDRARARVWWTAVAGHLRIVEDETQALRADLEPVFHGEALSSVDAEGRTSADIQSDAARLLEMAAANDTEIGRAFSRALQATDTPIAVRSTAFRDALRATERLASNIRAAALPAR